MITTLLVLIMSGLFLPVAEASRPVINYTDFVGLAKVSIIQEVNKFNKVLGDRSISDQAIKNLYPRKTNVFVKGRKLFHQIGIFQIDPAYLLDKCIFDQEDILNLMSPVLTLRDDETYAKKNRLSEVHETYGIRFYKTIYHLCGEAKSKFEKRIERLVFKNAKFALPVEDQTLISRLIFLPTLEGKKTALDYLSQREVGAGVLVVGVATGAAFGVGLPGVILSLIYVADEAYAFFNSLRNLTPHLYTVNYSDLMESEVQYAFELSKEEEAMLKE